MCGITREWYEKQINPHEKGTIKPMFSRIFAKPISIDKIQKAFSGALVPN